MLLNRNRYENLRRFKTKLNIFNCEWTLNRWFSRYVIAVMLVDKNNSFLINSFCSSTSICTFHHCYLSQ